MSVTLYDGTYSFRQNELATKGIQHGGHKMSAEQAKSFEASPFMVKARQQEEYTSRLSSERDKLRQQTDKDFQPREEDFTAAKAFDYDKGINYYTVLGVDEYAPLEEVKKAYKKLSLLYHPDKTAGLTKEEAEEKACVFIEIKNAYLVLGDQATRRQYDRDRDSAAAGSEVNGYKRRKDRVPFDATEMMKKIQEHYKPPGREMDVEVHCKLEKFFYGGTKCLVRGRRVIRDFQESHEDKQFRIDVPKGADEPWECKMKGGDMHLETQTDILRFLVKSKPHKVLERRGRDLHVVKEQRLRPDAHLQPFLSTSVNTVEGRTVILWGQNPLYSQAASSKACLGVSLKGEGIGETGQLHFSARVPSRGGQTVVRVRTSFSKLVFYVGVAAPLAQELMEAIRELLQWAEDHPVTLKMHSQTLEPDAVLAGDEVLLDTKAERLVEVPMGVRRARELLAAVSAFAATESFLEGISDCVQAVGTARHEALLRKLWEPACSSALLCGYQPCLEGLWLSVQRALYTLRGEAEALSERMALLGFVARRPVTAWVPRRRPLPRLPVEAFLLRNGLGPKRWLETPPEPGSETEPEEEAKDFEDWRLRRQREEEEEQKALQQFLLQGSRCDRRMKRGPYGAAAHPLMLRRAEREAEAEYQCDLELEPLFPGHESMQLFTKPSCFLRFYSNARQLRRVQCGPGRLQPTPVYAVSVCCPTGAKRAGREEWMRLRHDLTALLKQLPLILLNQARQLLPRQLCMDAAASSYKETGNISVSVGQSDCPESEESEEENQGEVIRLARQRVQEKNSEVEVDFDDLDVLEELEEAVVTVRRERKDQRRALRAAREVREREAKLDVAKPLGASDGQEPAWLWKRLGAQAFQRGDYYLAQLYFTKEAKGYGLDGLEPMALPETLGDPLELSTALSNRSLCLAKLGYREAALVDGRGAAQLRPQWARAWSRVGAAAQGAEAVEAWRKAVELEPEGNVEGLEEACRLWGSQVHKEQGNKALRARDWHGAIACFTQALASIPKAGNSDSYNLLRCILYSNRSGAFARAGRWQAAVRDAELALAEGQDYPKAQTRLGVALLGCRENEKAYVAFATALKVDERNQAASKGRQACLHLAPRWHSSAARHRASRFLRDALRPKGSSRIFLLSELRFGHASNENWVHGIHATKFLDDVLVLTGNVADSFRALERALTALKPKFRRIFYTPGNNEMWITPMESAQFPDSLCKLWAILELCDRLGVDVAPAAVSEGVFLVPLFSWYNPEFDTEDPYPDPQFQHDKYAKWPMDPNHQVWRYMMALNRQELNRPYHGTVITFSHFVPRSSLPVSKEYGGAKVSGCAELDDQLRDARSSCHLYGHSFKNFSKEVEGVAYINCAHTSGGQDEPIPCIFDGEKLCCNMVSVH